MKFLVKLFKGISTRVKKWLGFVDPVVEEVLQITSLILHYFDMYNGLIEVVLPKKELQVFEKYKSYLVTAVRELGIIADFDKMSSQEILNYLLNHLSKIDSKSGRIAQVRFLAMLILSAVTGHKQSVSDALISKHILLKKWKS